MRVGVRRGLLVAARLSRAASAEAPSTSAAVPFDHRWTGPGDGGSGTQPTVRGPAVAAAAPGGAASAPSLRLAADSSGSKLRFRDDAASDGRPPPLSASSFSPDRLRALGVGGLDAELGSLFRRAFASRALAPALARQLGVQHVRGVLLHGPPGTGKTLVARTLGSLLSGGKPPRVVNGPELLSRWVGASEENVRNLFADAESDYRANGDAAGLHVIIFDELDALCRARGSGGGGGGGAGVGDSVVNQLLTKLDGVRSAPNTLVIGLTNRRDLLDEALLRPGRLEVQLEIGLPDEAGRLAILGIHTAAMRQAGLLAPCVDLASLASSARNYSGAELAGVVRSAASFAVERLLRRGPPGDDTAAHGVHGRGLGLGQVSVTAHDFESALDEVPAALGARPPAPPLLQQQPQDEPQPPSVAGAAAAGGALARPPPRGPRLAPTLAAMHAPRGLLPLGPRLSAASEVVASLAALLDGDAAPPRGGSGGGGGGGGHHHPARPAGPRQRSVLLVGPRGAGKTAAAAAAADAAGYPFARVVAASAEAAAGVAAAGGHGAAQPGGDGLAVALLNAFADARRSPAGAVLVLDDVDALLGWSPVGPAYSNAALQALRALLRPPPFAAAPPGARGGGGGGGGAAGRRLLVVGTTSQPEAVAALGLADAFDAVAHIPLLNAQEAAAALTAVGACGGDGDDGGGACAAARGADAAGERGVAVRLLLDRVDLARQRQGAGGAVGDEAWRWAGDALRWGRALPNSPAHAPAP